MVVGRGRRRVDLAGDPWLHRALRISLEHLTGTES